MKSLCNNYKILKKIFKQTLSRIILYKLVGYKTLSDILLVQDWVIIFQLVEIFPSAHSSI